MSKAELLVPPLPPHQLLPSFGLDGSELSMAVLCLTVQIQSVGKFYWVYFQDPKHDRSKPRSGLSHIAGTSCISLIPHPLQRLFRTQQPGHPTPLLRALQRRHSPHYSKVFTTRHLPQALQKGFTGEKARN